MRKEARGKEEAMEQRKMHKSSSARRSVQEIYLGRNQIIKHQGAQIIKLMQEDFTISFEIGQRGNDVVAEEYAHKN